MLDIGGFVTSTTFITQIASIVTALLSAIFGELFTRLLGG